MGIGNLGKIARKLIDGGRPAHSPVAVISNGTTPNQKTLTGTLKDIEQKAKDANLTPPGVIVVGDVVGLRGHLNWFETRPLFGKNILVTRPEDQAAGFVGILSGLGARCVQIPAIRIIPPTTWEQLDRAIAGLSIYDWALFTSINGVKYFFERLHVAKKDARHLSGIKIAVIGPKTAEALFDKGVTPDLIPDEYSAEGMVEALHEYPLKGKRVLLPRPAIARDYLPGKLKTMGAIVDVVEAYQTVQAEYDHNQLDDLFKNGAIHMVTFTSPSTVDNFLDLFEGKSVGKESSKILVACIGPITARRATEKGLRVTVVPDEYTGDALARAIVEFYKIH